MSVSSPNYKYYKNYTLKKQPTLWFVFPSFLYYYFSLFVYFSLLLLFSCPSPFVITLLEVCVHHSTNVQRYVYKLVCSTLANFRVYVICCVYGIYICCLTVYELDSTTPKKAIVAFGPQNRAFTFPTNIMTK